jgi:4-hydroxy-tetrahydrodipicolinate reductase
MRLVILGAGGRMGRALIRLMAHIPAVTLVGAVEHKSSEWIGQDAGLLAGLPASGIRLSADIVEVLGRADGIVDFSTPAATLAALAAGAGIIHIIGTTGFSAADETQITAASQRTAIVKSDNMSVGVNLLAAVVTRVAAALDAEFDVEILEMHHNQKVDAPSGTALLLGRAAAQGRGIDLNARAITAREGHTGVRPKGNVGFAALRGGTVVGDHTVIFAGPSERLEFTHRAEDRTIFARGAIRAALWARGKAPGIYSMADVLGS